MLLGCERRMGDSAAAGRQQNQPQGQKAVDIMALLWADPTNRTHRRPVRNLRSLCAVDIILHFINYILCASKVDLSPPLLPLFYSKDLAIPLAGYTSLACRTS